MNFIEPCPWCGNNSIKIVSTSDGMTPVCKTCGVHGPSIQDDDVTHGINVWNHRPGNINDMDVVQKDGHLIDANKTTTEEI